MKRPVPIYFIALWSFLLLTMQTHQLMRLGGRLLPFGPIGPRGDDQAWTAVGGIAFIFVIAHAVRLAQLKVFNRWLAVVSFAWAVIWLTGLDVAPVWVEGPSPKFAVSAIAAVASLASMLYLVHWRSREFAVQFVAEREREKKSSMVEKTLVKNSLAMQKTLRKDMER